MSTIRKPLWNRGTVELFVEGRRGSAGRAILGLRMSSVVLPRFLAETNEPEMLLLERDEVFA